MSIKVKTGLVSWWFTPKQEEGDQVTRFKLKPLTGSQNLDISAELSAGRISAAQKIAIRYGLQDWENLVDQNDQVVDYSKENIDLLGADILAMLANAILNHSQMDDEQRKN